MKRFIVITVALTSVTLASFAGCETAEARPKPSPSPKPALGSKPRPATSEPVATASGATGSVTVTATVDGLKNTTGGILAYLHSESSFPRDFSRATKAQHRKSFDSTAMTLRFSDVAPGTYALVVVHDENGNGKLDKNLVGFPKEGIGASNVARGRPSWTRAKFDLTADRAVSVTIQYL